MFIFCILVHAFVGQSAGNHTDGKLGDFSMEGGGRNDNGCIDGRTIYV